MDVNNVPGFSVLWIPPPHSWVKLNTDGSVQSGSASCGGLLRGEDGEFLFAFSTRLGECSIMLAELWGILIGLGLVAARGFHNIIIDSYSKSAIALIHEGCHQSHPCAAIIRNIWDIAKELHVCFNHVFREVNAPADLLSKYGHGVDQDVEVFDSVLAFLSLALLADRSATVFSRGV
ncbi:hypothetical protein RIF29_34872 [Crotalaria pallida]|uniref:RNase H type-1 domain-containing protein n=1 Tax=Crotalaria pallida TaxID=3830 RepID=A0AAN9EAJ6_CROPI